MSWGSTKPRHISWSNVDGLEIFGNGRIFDDSFSSYQISLKAYRNFQPVGTGFSATSPTISGYVIIEDEIELVFEEGLPIADTDTVGLDVFAIVSVDEDLFLGEQTFIDANDGTNDYIFVEEQFPTSDSELGLIYAYDTNSPIEDNLSIFDHVQAEQENFPSVIGDSLSIAEAFSFTLEDPLTAFYLDPANGDDTQDGLTFATRVKTFTTGLTAAKINAQIAPYIVRSNAKPRSGNYGIYVYLD